MKSCRVWSQVRGGTRRGRSSSVRRRSSAPFGWLAAVAAVCVAWTGPAEASGLLIPTGGNRSLAIQSQKVHVTINNGVAVTTVTQVFKNDSAQPLEALYVFPVPREASVSNFSMWIGGKEVVGEVLERGRAQQIYRQVTRVERKDPGLLEQVDSKTFEMRVFPVPARGTQQIQITYYQPVDYDTGFGTYVYPLEMKAGAVTDLDGEFSVLVDVKSDIPIKQLHSPSHGDALVTAELKSGHYRASVENVKGKLDRDFVLVYELERERMGINLLTSREKGDDGYFMLLVTPGPQFDEPKRQVNATFVLDVSGSMQQAGKLDVARRAVAEAIGLLKETDTFNIVAFNIAPRNFAEEPVAAAVENRRRAIEFLKGLDAKGGTDIVPALERAFTMQVPEARNAVVLLSDGQATDIDDHSGFMTALRRRTSDVRIFSFGIGNDVNRPLLDRIAVETGGIADYLSGQDEINRKVRLMAAKLASPAAENLAVRFDGVEVFDVSPARLPNLYRGQQLVLFGRYHKSGEAKLTMTGQFLGQPTTLTATLDFPAKDADNPQIQRMWAWRMVDEKLQQIREHGESAGPISDVVALGTKYSIVTPYTAFLVLENEAAYQRFQIDRLNAQRTTNERAAQERQRDATTPAQPARDVQWSTPSAQPSGSNNGGGAGGGGSVEWLFLAGLGTLAAGRLWSRNRRRGSQERVDESSMIRRPR